MRDRDAVAPAGKVERVVFEPVRLGAGHENQLVRRKGAQGVVRRLDGVVGSDRALRGDPGGLERAQRLAEVPLRMPSSRPPPARGTSSSVTTRLPRLSSATTNTR